MKLRRHNLAGIALLVVAVLAGCSDGEQPESDEGSTSAEQNDSTSAVQAGVWEIESSTIIERRRWTGRLSPLQIQEVRAPRDATVVAVEVQDAEKVERGQVLVRLSGPDVVARKSVLMERRQHLQQELERWQGLAEIQAAGPAEVNEATLRLLEVEESLAEVDASLQSYVVRAPASGRVVAPGVGPGAHVSQGQELLRLEDAAGLGLRLSIPGRETHYFRDAEEISVYDEGEVELSIDRISFADDTHDAFVEVRIFLAEVEDDRRRELTVRHEYQEEVLLVPWTAVASDDDEHWVSLVVGDPAKAERRVVTLGRAHAAGLEVKSGLSPGDLVLEYEPRSVPEGREVESLRMDR